jgi:hypothetical protein
VELGGECNIIQKQTAIVKLSSSTPNLSIEARSTELLLRLFFPG